MFFLRDPLNITLYLKVIFLCFGLLATVSCNDPDDRLAGDCKLATDTVSAVDKVVVEGVTYHLVLKVAGWHDKTEIIEIYDTEPSFNECAQSNITPIFSDSLELDQTVSRVLLDVETKTAEIQYTSRVPEKNHNLHLKLEIKHRSVQ